MLDMDVVMVPQPSPQKAVERIDFAIMPTSKPLPDQPTPTNNSTEETFESAREEPTRTAYVTAKVAAPPSPSLGAPSSPVSIRAPSPVVSPRSPSPRKIASPIKSSPLKSSPLKQVQSSPRKGFPSPVQELNNVIDVHEDDEIRSPSDGSSPIRPIVRKSSLNFASLPAREPLRNKSLGGPSNYFNRNTHGKSLGDVIRQEVVSNDEDDEDDMADETAVPKEDATVKLTANSKSYTQRLQDQISMLGKAQPAAPRPSKSIANLLLTQPSVPAIQPQPAVETKSSMPMPKQSIAAPGAFPEDDEDDWIEPPRKPAGLTRPEMPKSHLADAVETIARKEPEIVRPRSRPGSPAKAPLIPERTTSTPKHSKSASVPSFPTIDTLSSADDLGLKKTVTVSNPTLPTVSEDSSSMTPSKSSRTFRGSPLKQVKDKLSRILTTSKSLLASSAAISAEGKISMLSPSTSRLGYHPAPSVESFRTAENVLYPDLSHHAGPASRPVSPARTASSRRTRASAEREKKETKEKEKEVKEAKRLAEQMDKLERAREKEAEKARVFSKEQEKMAMMEKQMAVHREQEPAPRPHTSVQELKTPAPAAKKSTAPSSPPKATRTSPRKTKGQTDGDGRAANPSSEMDLDMADVPSMPPPSVPRSAIASASRPQTIKRQIKPAREPLMKAKQAPTVIRVNTTSSQHSQLHTSNSALSANLGETLGQQPAPARQLTSKPSHTMLQSKSSIASLKASVSSNGPGRPPKAISLAAKRKEQEEREAQRKRDAKLEAERRRAAEEERRQEELRRLDAERQKEEERKAKKATIEKAKQTKAPPPASRPQPNGPADRPASRLGTNMQQDSRPINGKAPSKRPLQQDVVDENTRPQQSRNMASSYHQSKEAKRMRMSEEFDQDIDMADSQPNLKGPPIRPSAGPKKVWKPHAHLALRRSNHDSQEHSKSIFSNGYTNVPVPSSSQNLLRTAVTSQHNGQMKASNPLGMAQVSKDQIVFAPNPNAPGQAHKTPARPPTGKQPKSAAKSSPRFPNGDAIELPEINTEDEDSDEDDSHIAIAPWADSPALKGALMAQEMVDPMQIFGPPRPINMEEVFNKSKDRFHKFRARTSSANWSGSDRLTEEDIRKDLQARDKMRRQGGWSYELGREMA